MTENIGPDGLHLYCYTQSCVYDKAWDQYTMLARGLVLDHRDQRVVATPFPKFFNAFEREQTIPNKPFEVWDKIDGSLIILFWRDEWHVTTKGAFNTVQAKQARQLLDNVDLLVPGTTYLLEYVGPDNRIIIEYPEPKLHLLSGYWEDGTEFDPNTIQDMASLIGWGVLPRHSFTSFDSVLNVSKSLPASREGFVVRFDDGYRLKIKGDEYCRIHALVSRITPIGVWEVLRSDEELHNARRHIPEEFLGDFDRISVLLRDQMRDLEKRIVEIVEPIHDLSYKEIGMRFDTFQFPEDLRRFVFPYLHARDWNGRKKFNETLHRAVRPTGNVLEGYTPSYMLSKLQEETS